MRTLSKKQVTIFRTLCLSTALVASSFFGSELVVAQDKIDFGAQVRPILSDRCFHCHGPDAQNQESDYRMDSEDGLLEQIERGDLDSSEVFQRIISDEPNYLMPPPDSNRKLSEQEKNIIKLWIEQGAPYEGHWAFDRPVRPDVPSLEAAKSAGWDQDIIDAWSENPIDAFVAQRLVKENLAPSRKADWETRVRRASMSLTGLLPSTDILEQAAGQAAIKDSDGDYRSVVEAILNSTDYAERQALRWLDASRYADTDGYQVDQERQNWPWRDWVVKAYRDNMPFDNFVIEQIAGDMIENATASQNLATAFNRNHRQNGEAGALAEEFLVENVIDRVETTSTVFLGLTFGCSRCHDHKYDPLSQEEFFQMFGYFNNIGERSIGKGLQANPTMIAGSPLRDLDPKWLDQVHEADRNLKQASRAYNQRFDKWKKEMSALVALVDKAKKENGKKSSKEKPSKDKEADQNDEATSNKPDETAVVISEQQQKQFDSLGKKFQDILRKPPKARKVPEKNQLDRFFGSRDPQQKKLLASNNRARREFSKSGGGPLATVMVMRERGGKPQPIYVLDRGQYDKPIKKKELSRGVPEVLLADGVSQPKDRLEFAKWLVSKNNPLTARVTVNRMWRDHFGVGLVKTVDDFGVQGEAPSHPELLDWLAVEFIESGWDVKAMQRLIVNSQAYQQSSRTNAKLKEIDPENRLLARGPRYRADGFSIRDIALQAAGLLNAEPGGPPVKPYQPDGLWEVVAANKGTRYVPDKGKKLYRKSMYSYWKRAVNPPRQVIFDAGGREVCSVQVRRTNTPLQALVMMNDQTFVEAARVLAQKVLEQDLESDQERISTVYSRAVGRSINESSLEILTESLGFFRQHYRKHPEAAKKLLSVGTYANNKKLDAVEHAAMTLVAHQVMNLDEFLTLE